MIQTASFSQVHFARPAAIHTTTPLRRHSVAILYENTINNTPGRACDLSLQIGHGTLGTAAPGPGGAFAHGRGAFGRGGLRVRPHRLRSGCRSAALIVHAHFRVSLRVKLAPDTESTWPRLYSRRPHWTVLCPIVSQGRELSVASCLSVPGSTAGVTALQWYGGCSRMGGVVLGGRMLARDESVTIVWSLL